MSWILADQHVDSLEPLVLGAPVGPVEEELCLARLLILRLQVGGDALDRVDGQVAVEVVDDVLDSSVRLGDCLGENILASSLTRAAAPAGQAKTSETASIPEPNNQPKRDIKRLLAFVRACSSLQFRPIVGNSIRLSQIDNAPACEHNRAGFGCCLFPIERVCYGSESNWRQGVFASRVSRAVRRRRWRPRRWPAAADCRAPTPASRTRSRSPWSAAAGAAPGPPPRPCSTKGPTKLWAMADVFPNRLDAQPASTSPGQLRQAGRRAAGAAVRRPGRLQEGDRRARTRRRGASWPRRPASGRSTWSTRSRKGLQRLHGEVVRRGRPGHPPRAQGRRGGRRRRTSRSPAA